MKKHHQPRITINSLNQLKSIVAALSDQAQFKSKSTTLNTERKFDFGKNQTASNQRRNQQAVDNRTQPKEEAVF